MDAFSIDTPSLVESNEAEISSICNVHGQETALQIVLLPPEVFCLVLRHLFTPEVFSLFRTGDHRMIRLICLRGSLQSASLERSSSFSVNISLARFPPFLYHCSGLVSLSLKVGTAFKELNNRKSISRLDWRKLPRSLTRFRFETTCIATDDVFNINFRKYLPNLTTLALSSPLSITVEVVKRLPNLLSTLSLEASFNGRIGDYINNIPASITKLNIRDFATHTHSRAPTPQTVEEIWFPSSLTSVSLCGSWIGSVIKYLPRAQMNTVELRLDRLSRVELEEIPRSTKRLVLNLFGNGQVLRDDLVEVLPPSLEYLYWNGCYAILTDHGIANLPRSLKMLKPHDWFWTSRFNLPFPPSFTSLPFPVSPPLSILNIPSSLTELHIDVPYSIEDGLKTQHWDGLPRSLTSLRFLRPPLVSIFSPHPPPPLILSQEDAQYIPSTLTTLITDTIDSSCWPFLHLLKLKELSVNFASFNDISTFKSLTKLVHRDENCPITWITSLPTTLPNLTELDLCPSNFSSKHLALLPRLLRSLSIRISTNFDEEDLINLPPHLYRLTVSSSIGITTILDPTTFSRLPSSLRFFHLPTLLDPTLVSSLSKFLPQSVELARFGLESACLIRRSRYNSLLTSWEPTNDRD